MNKTGLDFIGKSFGRLTVIEEGKTVISPKTDATGRRRYRNFWKCQCSCGKRIEAESYNLTAGNVQSCGCQKSENAKSMIGELHPNWIGGRTEKGPGYIQIRVSPGIFKAEHRYVMEQHIGRELFPTETVHHKNGVRDDNRLENLELWNKSHPPGQRVEDKIAFAVEILKTYKPDFLKL